MPMRICSALIVFLFNWLQISLASELNRCINSVQQFKTSSRASFAILTDGTSSLIILFMLALGSVNSSSSALLGALEVLGVLIFKCQLSTITVALTIS